MLDRMILGVAHPDDRPTPISMVVAPLSELPPETTLVEVDARIRRLLAENTSLMIERKQLLANLKDTQDRSSALLGEARKAKKLARAYVELEREASADLSGDMDEPAEIALCELAAWAAIAL